MSTEPNSTASAASTIAEDPVKVNNASVTDLKNACDDALKRVLDREGQFKQQHRHIDVRLGLGYANTVIAVGSSLYGWKYDFETAKPVVWVGVILYVLLSAAQTLYTWFIEKDTVYVGKRKTFAKRVESERITIASRTVPHAPSPLAGTPAITNAPSYSLTLSYVRTSGGGKTLIRRSNLADQVQSYSAFFEDDGTLDEVKYSAWVEELVKKVVGEEDGSTKVE
ncbi:hypothetical protein BOTBODRAFT_140652 [Botryobasidium botryosum FD-172 SS1]|uniref:Signal peptidase complex subunit 2 n=1 Tax=Botryobasidium botryosum (strain FD-172 SS1) TaxID=930990 RepID=A0A067LX62_BOTB1|nr:hypothetical protein BOTBODRAFT_140652 [Botryobasidium botryosum FD-172 SS1]